MFCLHLYYFNLFDFDLSLDITLNSLGYTWKLHKQVIFSSKVLGELFNEGALQNENTPSILSRPTSRNIPVIVKLIF